LDLLVAHFLALSRLPTGKLPGSFAVTAQAAANRVLNQRLGGSLPVQNASENDLQIQ